MVCALLGNARAWSADATQAPIVVFGAASLTNVLQELGDSFTRETSVPVRFSFAASSSLARQIENGSMADIFFSADVEWMDYLQMRRLIQDASRHNVIGNRLVLIAPTSSTVQLKIAPHFALNEQLKNGRLATGDPDSVPAGRYAKQALTNLGLWDSVESRLVRADSVRSALAFVDRGEAVLGIVYESDALIDNRVRVVDTFPETSHEPILYPVALTNNANAASRRFVAYISGSAGALAFKHYGFTTLH